MRFRIEGCRFFLLRLAGDKFSVQFVPVGDGSAVVQIEAFAVEGYGFDSFGQGVIEAFDVAFVFGDMFP